MTKVSATQNSLARNKMSRWSIVNRWIIYLCVLLFIFLGLHHFVATGPWNQEHKKSIANYTIDNYNDQITPEKVGGIDCSPIKDIYYVKIHKTGSTTFQNILNRFGLSHDMKFALFRCPYAMSYPHPPNASFLAGKKFMPVGNGSRPYNILKDHTMYDRQAAMEYMPDDTKVISLIRHPFSQLTSSFSFFKLPQRFDMPKEIEDPVKEFLSRPAFYDKGRVSYSCKPDIPMSHTKNPQANHLGWKSYNVSDGMEEWIEKLDQELSLVSRLGI